ncbi:MAG: hypothetical protein NPIRA02_19220 [Nitrospirales bacterium]|nr:MAG: hypothetical protein NPIRA02_19220 [Nitrospirales bacterium]
MTSTDDTPLSRLLEESTALLSQLPDTSFPVILLTILVLIALTLWLIWGRESAQISARTTHAEPVIESLNVSTRPLLPHREASILNIVRLAVQDSYLVLAKLPLTSVLTIEKDDPAKWKAIMKAIQHIRLDLALIHPGTLQLEKVIRITAAESSTTLTQEKDQLATAMLQSAGIATITLDANESYTIPQVLELLGLAEED